MAENKYGNMVTHARRRYSDTISLDTVHQYTVHRGLKRIDSVFDNYLDILPTFQAKGFLQILKEKVDSRRKLAEQGENPAKIVIVDIGFGKGNFLLDLHQKALEEGWREHIELVGFGPLKHAKIDTDLSVFGVKKVIPATFAQLQEAGIKLVEGNAIDINRESDSKGNQMLGKGFADIIVASNSLQYVTHASDDIGYPQWELIKKIYRTLKPEGVALLDVGVDYGADTFILQDTLRQAGYAFEVIAGVLPKISFQKTKHDLNAFVRRNEQTGRLMVTVK